jgi:hypothetical protein
MQPHQLHHTPGDTATSSQPCLAWLICQCPQRAAYKHMCAPSPSTHTHDQYAASTHTNNDPTYSAAGSRSTITIMRYIRPLHQAPLNTSELPTACTSVVCVERGGPTHVYQLCMCGSHTLTVVTVCARLCPALHPPTCPLKRTCKAAGSSPAPIMMRHQLHHTPPNTSNPVKPIS